VNRQSKPSSTRADHFIKDQKEKACQISLESLFEGILEKKKKSKWPCALSIIVVLIDGVAELKHFETLRGSTEKIETLVVELKIAANF
jgi:hypothetical protein